MFPVQFELRRKPFSQIHKETAIHKKVVINNVWYHVSGHHHPTGPYVYIYIYNMHLLDAGQSNSSRKRKLTTNAKIQLWNMQTMHKD